MDDLNLESFLEQGAYVWKKDALLSDYSTFRIGGPADVVVFPKTAEQMRELITYLRRQAIRYVVIGNGSNLLFSDRGYRGVVVQTSHLCNLSIDGNVITADCGVSLTRISSLAQKNALSGMEFAYGIPGSCGGALYMNAGAFGGDMQDVLLDAQVLDPKNGNIYTLSAAEHQFGYRQSIYSETDQIVLSARLSFREGNAAEIRKRMDEHMQYRVDHQPLNQPSAGSVFKRYPGYYTSKLIEEAGLKGRRVGDAMVSPKHAGFIVNCGHASASDVLQLIDIIKEEIWRKNAIHISCEVKIFEE